MNAIAKGNPKGAIVYLRSAVEKDAAFTEARVQLANALAATGKMELAEQEYLKVLELDPARAIARLALIAIHIKTKKADLAVREAERFLQSTPRDPMALELLGIAYLSMNRLDPAEKCLLQALAIDPGRDSTKLKLAALYQAKGNLLEAKRLTQEVTASAPRNLQATCLLAELELQAGNRANALAIYLRAYSSSKDPYPLYRAGLLYLDSGAKAEALSTANTLLRECADKAEGPQLHGLVAYADRNYPDAIAKLTASLKIHPSVEAYFFLGLSYYNIQNFESALLQFQKILAIGPSLPHSRFLTALILLKQQRPEAVIAETARILESDPDHPQARALLGRAYLAKGEFAAGMRELNRARRLDPTIITGDAPTGFHLRLKKTGQEAETLLQTMPWIDSDLMDRGLFQIAQDFERSDYLSAIRSLKNGLTGKVADAEIYNNIAEVWLYTPNGYDAALAAYRSALLLAPGNTRALLGAAAILELKGGDREAFECYLKAGQSHSPRTTLALAAYLQRTGQPARALATLQEAIRANPDNSEALLPLTGQILLAEKKYQEALSVFDTLEALDPDNGLNSKIETCFLRKEGAKALELAQNIASREPKGMRGYILTAAVYERRNDLDSALKELAKARQIDSTNPEVLVNEGNLLMKKADRRGAAKAYADALAQNPEFLPALLAQGLLLQQNGDRSAAIEANRAIIAKFPDHVPAINNLAMLLLEEPSAGRVQEGLRLAFTAFRLAPDNPSVIDTLGYALLKAGQKPEARKLLEKAVTLFPGNQEVAGHLEKARK